MKICIIWKNDYPWDVRIEKISNSLRDAGHEIYLLSSNKGRSRTEEIIDGIKVIRMPFVNNQRLNSFLSSPFYLNPFWLKMADRIVRREKIDIIIVRDLPLILIGLFIKKKYHIPLIFDMAENYPAMYWNRFKKGGSAAFKNWFVKNPYLVEYIENYAIKHVDHLLVVVEESSKRLVAKGVDERNISIVSNTPDLKMFALERRFPERGKPLTLMYVGFIQEVRGLETVIYALARIKDSKGIPFRFIIIGDGDYSGKLKALVKELSLDEIVEFKGWIKNNLIPEYIYKSDIGVIPHKKTGHTDTTIPNKLFDFMACGKPVIVSNADPMKRIVEKENCGMHFRSGDSEDFCRVLRKVIESPDSLAAMGTNGQRAVKSKYNWGYDSMVLRRAVEKFAIY